MTGVSNTQPPQDPQQDSQNPTAVVVVASTRAAAGDYADTSGALAVTWLREHGFETPDAHVIADCDIPDYLNTLLADRDALPRIILTSGGTGLSADDRTVETVRPHLDKELPGIMAQFFALGAQHVPTAVLSGGVAGTIGHSFVMTLPGSRGGVEDGLAVLEPIIDHIVALLEGQTAHE